MSNAVASEKNGHWQSRAAMDAKWAFKTGSPSEDSGQFAQPDQSIRRAPRF